MNKIWMLRIAGVTVVGCLLLGMPLYSSGQPADAEAEDADPFYGVALLRGLELPVRDLGEAETTEKTQRIPVETYFDADYGNLVYATKNGNIAVAAAPSDFQLRTVLVGESMEAVKYRASSGECWRMEEQRWLPVGESDAESMTVGDYEVQLMADREAELVVMIRFDRRSGDTWFINADGNWEAVADRDAEE